MICFSPSSDRFEQLRLMGYLDMQAAAARDVAPRGFSAS